MNPAASTNATTNSRVSTTYNYEDNVTPVQQFLSQHYIKSNHDDYIHKWQNEMKFKTKCLDTSGLLQSKFQNTESTKIMFFYSLTQGVAGTVIVAQVLIICLLT